MQIFKVLSIIATFSASNTWATICAPDTGKADSPHDYIIAVIDSLHELRIGRDSFQESLKLITEKSDPSKPIVAIRTYQDYISCAATKIEKYKNSTNNQISSSANGFAKGVNDLSDLSNASLKQYKDALDGKSSGTASENAEYQANISIGYDKAWEIIMLATASATYSLITESEKIKPSRLTITSQERLDIIRRFEKAFGKKISAKENKAIELAAFSILKVLKDKWKTSDNK